MKSLTMLLTAILFTFLYSCNDTSDYQSYSMRDSVDHTQVAAADELSDTIKVLPATKTVETRNVKPDDLIDYAKTLIGTTYKYGSIDPKQGFDCSGFITHVFNHFDIAVPRSSVDFTNVGEEIPVNESKPGDLILFTGTDSTIHVVGHMGIIVENTDSTRFIHSTSGKQYGVTITPLNSYYQGRFYKVIRVFQ